MNLSLSKYNRNHWSVDQTGLGDLKAATFNYMTQNWMPRGTETARLVYGADAGWVTHDEMNLFGHTGYKSSRPCLLILLTVTELRLGTIRHYFQLLVLG
jgi:hypothetical protein